MFKKVCAYAKYIRTSSESKYVPYAHIPSIPKRLKNLPLGQPHARQMKQHRISVANCCSKFQCSIAACQQFHVAWIWMWCFHGLLLGFMMIRSKECTSCLLHVSSTQWLCFTVHINCGSKILKVLKFVKHSACRRQLCS